MKSFLYIFLLFMLVSNIWASQKPLDKITLQLQWKHQFEFAGFYAAKEKGYYEDAGLDVDFVEYNPKIKIVEQVLNNSAQYGVGYSSLIADFYKDKPIVLLANFFKHSPLVLVTQKSIHTVADLKGKRIMGNFDTIENITLLNMFSKFNIDPEDYVKEKTDFKITKFINKEVDAMSVYTTNEIYDLDKVGVDYNVFNPSIFGFEYYDCNLFTSKYEVQFHPDRARKFTEASIRGWEYALSHKRELVDIILQKYNSQNKSLDALLFEAQQIESVMLKNVYPIGMIDTKRVAMIAENLKATGYIATDNYKDLDKFIFMDNTKLLSKWYILNFFHYVNSKLVWEFLFVVMLIMLMIMWKNATVKRLNRELVHKVEEAISETQAKDRLLFHQSKLTSMGEMMENIAHQWRQPLSQINSTVLVLDTLLEEKNIQDKEIDNRLLEIESLTLYMSKTISDFQEFFEPRKQKTSFFLRDTVYDGVSILKPTLKEHKIGVNIHAEDKKKVYSYQNELKQVIVILLTNAKDILLYKEVENAYLGIELYNDENYSYVTICDNGGGIAGENIDKIFDPYFTTKHKTQGTGLGLYIAKLIVEESCQGELSVRNTESGACFEIKLKGDNE